MNEHEAFGVQCGECGSDFQVDATHAGSTVHCPHCDCPAEIPSLAEIVGQGETSEDEVGAKPRPAATRGVTSGATKKSAPKKQPAQKKQQRERSTEQAASGSKSRGKVKATSARSSVNLLLKMPGLFYAISGFVLVAWSVKVIGTLYPIVNTKRGSYTDWFIEATITTAWAAALVGLLIAVAELITVIIYIQENITNSDD